MLVVVVMVVVVVVEVVVVEVVEVVPGHPKEEGLEDYLGSPRGQNGRGQIPWK